MLESLSKDVKFGIRQLRKSPGFTIVAVSSLALGLGANVAIFQLVNAIRLKSLPVEKPQELATINFQQGARRSGWWSGRSAQFTYGHLKEIRARQEAFTGVIAWSATRFNLANGGEARYAEGLYVSGDFFELLGVKPYLGRTFTSEDDDQACGHVGAVISNAFWQREFGSDRGVVGRTISVEGHPIPIIGVTGPAFFGVEVGSRFDVAIPLCAERLIAEAERNRLTIPHAWWLSLMGRLKPGWTADRATAHLVTISPGIMQATLPPMYKPDTAKGYLANKLEARTGGTGVSGLRREYERSLWLLMATTGLVLLIACANLANLLLARASNREREVAVRLAVGASRWRLVRQFLIESLLLAIAGAALGALIAQFVSRGLIASITTANRPLFVGLGLDLKVLGFMTGLAVLTCILFGLVPALRATGLELASSIRSGGRSMTAGREGFSLRRSLVALQIALSLVLLVGALLFVRSLRNLMNTEAGFKSEGVMTVSIDFRKANYPKERRLAVQKELNDTLARIPGVVSAAQTFFTPVSGSGWDNKVGPDGQVAANSQKDSFFNRVSPGYFRTLGTNLIAGRDFDDHDTLTSPKVAIVNEKFAREFFGGANPVGHTFHLEAEAGKPEPVIQIVGLVRNMKYYELKEDFLPIGFFPMAQEDDPGPEGSYVLRVGGSPSALINSIKGAVASVNPTMGLEFRSFSEQLQQSLMREQLMARLSGAFGILAVLLATIGLYGVIAYMVARRQNEIGVRIALGADRKRVIALVLREALLLLAIGLPAGILMALLAGRAAAALLYGLRPWDPVSLIAAAVLLAVVALAATYGPARRAAALEPMVALRSD